MPPNDSIEVLISALRNRIDWEQELDVFGYPHLEPAAPPVPAENRPFQPVPHANPVQSTPPHTSERPAPQPAARAPHRETVSTMDSPKEAVQALSAKPVFSSESGSANQTKAKALSELKFDLEKCSQCKLHQHRKRIVFSDGTMNAELVFVGDTPSIEEELVSLPFLGTRGHLLNKIILAIGSRRETSYLCNVIKCTPQSDNLPTAEEFSTCGAHLLKQLQLVSPKVVVALGQEAASTLLGTDTPVAELRGKFYSKHNMQIMPTYSLDHMLATPASKRDVWVDMKLVKQLLEK